jgi:hypothetical protein
MGLYYSTSKKWLIMIIISKSLRVSYVLERWHVRRLHSYLVSDIIRELRPVVLQIFKCNSCRGCVSLVWWIELHWFLLWCTCSVLGYKVRAKILRFKRYIRPCISYAKLIAIKFNIFDTSKEDSITLWRMVVRFISSRYYFHDSWNLIEIPWAVPHQQLDMCSVHSI